MRSFSFLRIFLLIIFGMLIFNIVMSVVTGEFQEDISLFGIFQILTALIMISIAGLIITPAAIGLSIYAIIMESIYAVGILQNFWIFSLLGAIVGVSIFMGFVMLVAPDKGWDVRMLTVMFISHGLTTMLVYRGKFRKYKCHLVQLYKFKGLADHKQYF